MNPDYYAQLDDCEITNPGSHWIGFRYRGREYEVRISEVRLPENWTSVNKGDRVTLLIPKYVVRKLGVEA